MRRCLVTATLVAALAMPAAALAGTRHFDGSVDPSGGISFDAKTRSGKVVKVLPGLAFDKVPVTCDGGKRTFTGNFDFGMAVRIGQFKGTGLYDPSGGSRSPVSSPITEGARTGSSGSPATSTLATASLGRTATAVTSGTRTRPDQVRVPRAA